METLIYLLIIFFSVAQSAAVKAFNRHTNDPALFNALKASVSFLMFLIMAANGFTLHLHTLFFGSFYGLLLCISMYTGYRALCLGPLALTSMLVSFSVLIPLIWGFAVRKESLNCAQITAIILLICAIALTNADKILVKCKSSAEKNCKQKSKYGLWWICVFATFFCNGICSILQKEHQMFYNGSYSKEFMFFAMLLCSIIFSGVLLFRFSLTRLRTVKGSLFGVLSGIGNGLANYLTLTLAGLEKASVLFPIISSGTLLGSIVCGKFLFKEKLRIHHYLAIVAGIIAVILLKL